MNDQVFVSIKKGWHLFLMWMNGVCLMLATVDVSGLLSDLPTIQNYVPPHFFKYLLGGATAINLLIHWLHANQSLFEPPENKP
ncbi:MAG: hypothetical protein ACYC9K_00875 [Sulfuricaulis sp.]